MSDSGGRDTRADSGAPRRGGFADIGIRTASSLVMAGIALLAGWYGGPVFRMFAAVIATAIFFEWVKMTPAGDTTAHWAVPAIALAVVLVAMLFGSGAAIVLPLLAAGILCSLVAGWVLGRDLTGAAGLVYAGLSGLSLAYLRDDDKAGLLAILFLFAVVWSTDILAYFSGRLVGGPKLAPAISPGKTWSGALGGTLGGIIAGLIFASVAGIAPVFALGLSAFLLAVFGQVGDLFESAVKRRYGVKDSSHIIPGHGGVMDRVDALVAAALALYVIGGVLVGFDHPAHGLFHS